MAAHRSGARTRTRCPRAALLCKTHSFVRVSGGILDAIRLPKSVSPIISNVAGLDSMPTEVARTVPNTAAPSPAGRALGPVRLGVALPAGAVSSWRIPRSARTPRWVRILLTSGSPSGSR